MQNYSNYGQNNFRTYENYDKNYSFASTIDPYSNLYLNNSAQNGFQGQQD